MVLEALDHAAEKARRISGEKKLTQNQGLMLLLALVGCVLIFLIDYVTVERYSFYFFYFMPIVCAAWFAGTRSAYLIAVLCSVTWYLARLNMDPPAETNILVWNSMIRFISFVFIAWTMNTLRSKQEKMRELQAKLENLLDLERNIARQCPLTGALNSRAFYEQLTQERSRCKRYSRPLSIVYIDLDGFKEMNDLHGHEFGDELLKKVVVVIKGCIRDVDLLARLGGDEFVILLPETEAEGAATCVQRIMETLKRDISKSTTISAGVVHYATCPETNEETVKVADQTMYEAKRSGKNKMVCKSV